MRSRRTRILSTFFAAGLAALAQSAPGRTPDVPYVPTANNVVQAMLKLAGVKNTDVVYDLGCGDGRIVITAAREFGARGVPTLIAECGAKRWMLNAAAAYSNPQALISQLEAA